MTQVSEEARLPGSRAISPPSGSALTVLVLSVIALAGLMFRLLIFDDSLFGDELSTYFVTNQSFGGMLEQVESPQEWSPPLYFALAWASSKLGSADWLLRLPSLLAGLATIPLVYLLGSMTVGRRAGMVAAALVCLSPMMIYYSAEARAYALLTFLVLCSTIVLLVAIDRGGVGWWVLYAVLVAASMYTHYTGVFTLVAQTGWALIVAPGKRKELALSVMLAGALWLPWLGQYVADATDPNVDVVGRLHPISARVIWQDYLQLVIGVGLPARAWEIPGLGPLIVFGAGLVVAAVDLVRRGFSRPGSRLAFVLVLALAAPVGAVISSLLGPDTFLPRTLLVSYPGLALTVGWLVTSRGRTFSAVATGLVLVGMAWAAIASSKVENRRPDYAAAVEFIERHGQPGDPIVDVSLRVPGAWQPLDSQLRSGPPAWRSPAPLRLGIPTLQSALEVRRPGGPGQFDPAFRKDVESPEEVASRVVASADRNPSSRRFFLVIGFTLGVPPYPDQNSLTGRFMAALPRGYRIVRQQTLVRAQGLGPTVYEVELPPASGNRLQPEGREQRSR